MALHHHLKSCNQWEAGTYSDRVRNVGSLRKDLLSWGSWRCFIHQLFQTSVIVLMTDRFTWTIDWKKRSSIRRWVWLPAGSHVDIFVQFNPPPPSALPPPTSLSLFTWFHILLLAYDFWPQQQCWCKWMRCTLRTVASCIFQRSPWIQEHFEVPLIDLALWSEGRLKSRRWKEKERETSWKTDRKQAGQLTSLCSAGEKLFCSSTSMAVENLT